MALFDRTILFPILVFMSHYSSILVASDANGKGEVNLTTYFQDLPPNKTYRVGFETWSDEAWAWQAFAYAPDSGNGTRAFMEGKSPKSDKGVPKEIDFVAKDNWIFFDITVRAKNASALVYASQFSPYLVE